MTEKKDADGLGVALLDWNGGLREYRGSSEAEESLMHLLPRTQRRRDGAPATPNHRPNRTPGKCLILSVVEVDRGEQKGNQTTETEQQTLGPSLQPGEIAAGIAKDAQENLAGLEVVNVGSIFADEITS